MKQTKQNSDPMPGHDLPWYKQFWPWFIIALPASAVVAGFYTLWLAINTPDYLVVDDEEYQRLNSSLKAQPAVREKKANKSDDSGLRSD